MGCDFGKNTKDSLICTIDKKDCIYYLPSVGKCYEERHTFYQQYIKLQNQQMQWISVKDKLPEIKKGVIVALKDGLIDCGCLNIRCFFKDDDSFEWYDGMIWQFGCGDRTLDSVTHWMPLPDYPTNEGNNNG